MQRSQPHVRFRSNGDCLALVADLAIGSPAVRDAAAAVLRNIVLDYTRSFAQLPIDWLDDSELARRAIAQRVAKLLANDDHRLVKEWRSRMLRRKDQAEFVTMLDTVIWYVTIHYARGVERER